MRMLELRARNEELADAHRALARSESHFRVLAEVAEEGVAVSRGGRVVDCNQALERILGRPRNELIGLRPSEVVVPTEVQRDRLKDQLISTISHELRTPLTSIRGALGLVEGGAAGELPDKAREMVRIAKRNGDRLARLVDQILDAERLRSGHLSIDMQPHQPRALSRRRWRTSPSPIRSSSTTGCPREDRGQLFQRFTQLDATDARAKGGSGLGLAISKALVDAHEGDVGVECPPEGGCVFWFELPSA